MMYMEVALIGLNKFLLIIIITDIFPFSVLRFLLIICVKHCTLLSFFYDDNNISA